MKLKYKQHWAIFSAEILFSSALLLLLLLIIYFGFFFSYFSFYTPGDKFFYGFAHLISCVYAYACVPFFHSSLSLSLSLVCFLLWLLLCFRFVSFVTTIYWYCRTLKSVELNWWTMAFIANDSFQLEIAKKSIKSHNTWNHFMLNFALDLFETDWTKTRRLIYFGFIDVHLWIVDALNSFFPDIFTRTKKCERRWCFSLDWHHTFTWTRRQDEQKKQQQKIDTKLDWFSLIQCDSCVYINTHI